MKRGECIKCGHTWPELEPDNCPKCSPLKETPCPLCKGARELDGYGGGSRTDCHKCGGTGKDHQPERKTKL